MFFGTCLALPGGASRTRCCLSGRGWPSGSPWLSASPFCFSSSWALYHLPAFHLSSPSCRTRWDWWGSAGLGRAARLGPWAAVSPCCVWRAPCIAAPSSCQLPLDHCSSRAGWLGTPPSPLQAQPLGFIRPSPAQDTTAAWVNHIHGMG